jgi:prepilin-type N-terminal cleavage/methylation domain-containing protein
MSTSLPTQALHTSRFAKPLTTGFTMAELLMVLAIIGVLTAMVVAQYRDFDSTTVLRNLAYEVALSIREAQVMTISASNLGGGGVFLNQGQNSYGVSFDANSQVYTIFNDLDADDVYDAPSELVKLITISQSASISSIREKRSDDSVVAVSSASVTFDRPHLDTAFTTASGSSAIVELLIQVTTQRGGSRIVHITKAGRVSVE